VTADRPARSRPAPGARAADEPAVRPGADDEALDPDVVTAGPEDPGEDASAEADDGLGAPTARGGSAVAPSALVPADTLTRYLAEIRRIPVLTREEEHALAVRWKEHGDREAARDLVTHNLRLVVMIAREYQRAVHNLLDLVQEGNVGLLDAIKNFDPYRGVRFPSYAVWWVRAYIIRYIMNNWRMVKVGTTQAQRKLFFNLNKERERLERQGFRPEPKLIAQRLGVKEDEVVEMQQRLGSRDLSVDAPIADDDGATMLDFLPGAAQTADAVATDELQGRVRDAVGRFKETLSGRDLVIYERRLEALMRDDDPATLQEIGDEFGITRERVRQVEARIKKRLRAFLEREMPEIADIEFGG
jgi:RNA polymerase sigma-32 factor